MSIGGLNTREDRDGPKNESEGSANGLLRLWLDEAGPGVSNRLYRVAVRDNLKTDRTIEVVQNGRYL